MNTSEIALDPSQQRTEGNSVRLWYALLGLALLISLLFLIASHDTPILDLHAFRQTQTALSAFWILQDGFRLAYETPVLGHPWSIPFEFPLYQGIVAALAGTGISMDFAGRLVAWVFYVASALMVFLLVRLLTRDMISSLMGATFYLVCPINLFWGTAFLIESTAVFLCLLFVYLELRLNENRDASIISSLLCGIALLMALLQKVTTVVPIIPIIGLITLIHYRRHTLSSLKAFILTGLRYVVPVLIYAAWQHYSDAIKARNEMGYFLTSTWPGMRAFTFGTLQQRFSLDLWNGVVLGRVVRESWGGLIVPFGIWGFVVADKRTRSLMLLGFLLFLLPLLVFTNLHVVHDYYQYSVIGSSAVVAALVMFSLRRHLAMKPSATNVIGALIVISMLYQFHHGYYKARIHPSFRQDTLPIADALKREFTKGSQILFYPTDGYDWSSEVPYYSGMRMAIVPGWYAKPLELVSKHWNYFDDRPDGLVICNKHRAYSAAMALAGDTLILKKVGRAEECDLFRVGGLKEPKTAEVHDAHRTSSWEPVPESSLE